MSKYTVDDLLNEVSYSDVAGYQPSVFALKFVSMIKLIHGGDPENKTPVVHYMMLDKFINESEKDTLNMCHRGFAKLQSGSSKVLTEFGWRTMRELQVNDLVVNRYGSLSKIIYKTEPKYPDMFLMTLSDGTQIEVGDEHNHIVMCGRGKERVYTTLELLDKGLEFNIQDRKNSRSPKAAYKWSIPLVEPVRFSPKELPVPAYILGNAIANGNYKGGYVSCHLDDMDFFSNELGTVFKVNQGSCARGYIGKELYHAYGDIHSRDKRIPYSALYGSVEQRLELLRGLMDGDGSISSNGTCSYSTYSEGLAEDVVELVQGLGGIAKYIGYAHKDSGSTEYHVHMKTQQCPFKLPRKADKWNKPKVQGRKIVSIEPMECKEEGYCIALDSKDKSYITEGYTVTHNTTVKMYLIWYIALFNELPDFGTVPYALYISDSMDNGVKKMRNRIEDTWNDSPFLQKMIPKEGMKITDPRWEFRNVSGKRFVVTGHGAQQKIRGTVENSSRPVLALLDDLISDEDARSDTAIRNIEATIYNAIEFALHPTRKKVIWSGTPFNARDPLYKAVESGAWAVNLYPVCEKFPCERSEFRGSWEDRFTYDSILKKYEKMKSSDKLDAFNQELMLRIMSEEDKVIEGSDIQWYSRKRLLANRGAFNFYITTDFAVSEKKSADFSVISVWAYNSKGDWFWVDGVCKQQLMDVSINDLFRLAQEYEPMSVGIEVTGQQGGFIQWIQSQMIDRGIFFNLASEGNSNNPGIRPRANKFDRFMKIVPWFKAKKIYLPTECEDDAPMREAVNELGLVTRKGFKSKHDDFIDTISMLDSMQPWRPSGNSGTERADGSIELHSYDDDDYGHNSSYIV